MDGHVNNESVIKEVNLTDVGEVPEEVAQSVADQVALGELDMRREAAKKIISLFKVTNIFVLGFLVLLLISDWIIYVGSGGKELPFRLIDKQVVMVLIGATTIQLGTIMLSISRFLFPTRK